MRAINAYQGLGERANVKMRTVYINSLPHIIIICIEDVEPDEEFFLDYGEEYTNMYLQPKEVSE
jgi:SET domain-containing protein